MASSCLYKRLTAWLCAFECVDTVFKKCAVVGQFLCSGKRCALSFSVYRFAAVGCCEPQAASPFGGFYRFAAVRPDARTDCLTQALDRLFQILL